MPRMVRLCLPLCALLLGACAIPNTIESLDAHNPPPEFGRPGWVRTSAGIGAWIGGLVGGVASIVALPVTYPLSLLASDGLGEQASSEFLLWPALGGAAFGHALLGLPTDVVDYVFRRVWVGNGTEVRNSYEFMPMDPPAVPTGPPAAAR
jgi:hypothetical protein